VHFAVVAFGVAHHVCLNIADPVGNIAGSSKGQDDGIESGGIACESLDITSSVVECLNVEEGIGFAP